LSAKGRTVAVLGTGINLVFPAENAELFERIAAQRRGHHAISVQSQRRTSKVFPSATASWRE
jgi:predicted Rossmann fold nucleotide-binding protein DprA/Smf involved in DNA uptake